MIHLNIFIYINTTINIHIYIYIHICKYIYAYTYTYMMEGSLEARLPTMDRAAVVRTVREEKGTEKRG